MKNNQHNHTLLVLKHLLITQKAHKYKLFTKLVDFVSEEQELKTTKQNKCSRAGNFIILERNHSHVHVYIGKKSGN